MSLLEKQFEFYLEHQNEFVKKYDGKVVVLCDNKLIGVYESEFIALCEVQKKYILGTFLIQKVSSGEIDYTQHYHSPRVSF